MKMKKNVLATVLFGCMLSGSVLAEKVTYDKAMADSKAYQDSLPHYENATSGLGPDEEEGDSSANQMGTWFINGSVIGEHTLWAHPEYGIKLGSIYEGVLNGSCLKGMKGTSREKNRGDSNLMYFSLLECR